MWHRYLRTRTTTFNLHRCRTPFVAGPLSALNHYVDWFPGVKCLLSWLTTAPRGQTRYKSLELWKKQIVSPCFLQSRVFLRMYTPKVLSRAVRKPLIWKLRARFRRAFVERPWSHELSALPSVKPGELSIFRTFSCVWQRLARLNNSTLTVFFP